MSEKLAMESAATHLSEGELEAGLAFVLKSPRETGELVAIFARPKSNDRARLPVARLSVEGGLERDRWATNHWQKLPDGSSDPQSQLSLMNARVLRLLAGDDEAVALAGDNLIVDLDLSAENLPAGTRLRIGDALLEITEQAHKGCAKFSRRYGGPARAFVNGENSAAAHLRGRYARVIQAGMIHEADRVVKE